MCVGVVGCGVDLSVFKFGIIFIKLVSGLGVVVGFKRVYLY